MARAMFPRHRMFGASAQADLAFTLFSVLGGGAMIGWAILSHIALSDSVIGALRSFSPSPHPQSGSLAVALMTLSMWLAYEFAYFADHWLSHKWPVLWAFHKVHHSAETLSPLTIFRVHPVDTLVFYNVTAIVTGLVAGVMRYFLGDTIAPMTLAGTNILLVAAIMTVKQLQHSHVWIAFTGPLGRIILSPAHHQIHHSVAVEHHDRNFGGTLALFDWLAGTLHIPATTREPLDFGVADLDNPHSLRGAVFTPFVHAAKTILPRQAQAGAMHPETPPSTPDILAAMHRARRAF